MAAQPGTQEAACNPVCHRTGISRLNLHKWSRIEIYKRSHKPLCDFLCGIPHGNLNVLRENCEEGPSIRKIKFSTF